MLNIIKWRTIIDQCKVDGSVGIRIAKIAGDANFSTYITEIDPGKSVNPHYHENGEEHYHIIKGNGQIYLKDVTTLQETTTDVSAGSSFVVAENVLHKLTNTGNETLILMFSCPVQHLETDRYFL
ncbi:MAG: cupin domain-containing protein [Burkholderiales bacterium]|nr:cupin domain-containing protein [Burkholderiales bacterium]